MLLFGGGELLTRGAVSLAQALGMSQLLIGLTVVAAATSMPELVVALAAALEGAPDIAVGNVVGSNIANIMLILGVAVGDLPDGAHAPTGVPRRSGHGRRHGSSLSLVA